ncbi:hypothetical protein [Nocardia phage P3.1]|nr:hypothetical protein [Nocardia phage P3.1]
MARSLKSRGLEELRTLRRRVERQYALGRILRSDREFLVKHLDEVEARITKMSEKNENGMEEFDGS